MANPLPTESTFELDIDTARHLGVPVGGHVFQVKKEPGIVELMSPEAMGTFFSDGPQWMALTATDMEMSMRFYAQVVEESEVRLSFPVRIVAPKFVGDAFLTDEDESATDPFEKRDRWTVIVEEEGCIRILDSTFHVSGGRLEATG